MIKVLLDKLFQVAVATSCTGFLSVKATLFAFIMRVSTVSTTPWR